MLEQWNVNADLCRQVLTHHSLPGKQTDAGLTLALFIAGLLPHDDGEIAPADLDRLMAVHGRVLHRAYATPDAFLGHAYVESQRRMGRDLPRDGTDDLTFRPYLDAIAANTIQLVSQVHRLQTSKLKQEEDLSTLRFEAFTDELTKVLNRRGFFNLAQRRLAETAPGVSACCMLLDLNDFKPVNDRHGHDAGDLMLRGLAKLLRRAVARNDLIGRLGGDEFVILVTQISEDDARVAATRVRDTALGKSIRIGPDREVPLSFSLGATYHDAVGGAVKLDQLLAVADELMYQRKRAGQPGMIFARYEDTSKLVVDHKLESSPA